MCHIPNVYLHGYIHHNGWYCIAVQMCNTVSVNGVKVMLWLHLVAGGGTAPFTAKKKNNNNTE